MQTKPHAAKPKKAEARNQHPIYGETGVLSLRASGDGDVPVATNKAAYKRLVQLAGADDTLGIQRLLTSGNVWVIDSGTRVTVIATDWTQFEVRINSGSHAGQSVFVKRDFVWSL